MTLRTRKASWLASGLLCISMVSAGFELVVAQPKSEPARPALDTSEATFELLTAHRLVNINNIAYISDEGNLVDIYFACTSVRGEAPLRLTNPEDIRQARSYCSDEKRYGKHFLKSSKYLINVKTIAYIEFQDDSVIIRFNARVFSSFLRFTLSGEDARTFMETLQRRT